MNKSLIKLVQLGLIVSLLTGCAFKPIPYNDKHSKAFNIYRSAGLSNVKDIDLTDPKVQDKLKKDGININDVVSYPSSLGNTFNNTLLAFHAGLSSGEILGVFLLSALDDSEMRELEKDGILAWMPTNLAKNRSEAREVFTKIVYDAIDKTHKENNIRIITTKVHESIFMTKHEAIVFESKELGCFDTIDGWCSWTVGFEKPYLYSSNFLNTQTQESYLFNKKNDMIYFRQAGKADALYKTEYLKKLSKNLPEWVAFYIGPKRVNGKRTVPYIIHKGEVHYFIKSF